MADERTESIRLRVSPEEKTILEARAADAGKSVSDFIRAIGAGAVEESRPAAPAETGPTPTLDALRTRLGRDVKVIDCPPGVDEAAYVERVVQLANGGMPYFNASKVAHEELLGVRVVDGPMKRQSRHPNVRRIRNERGERLDRAGNVIPNPMPPMAA